MALSRRTGQRFQASIWPGFVDAMTGLLLVLMFVLTIFMVVQFVLRETITGQATRLDKLSAEIVALSEALGLEQDRNATLAERVGTLTTTLGEARERAAAQVARIAELEGLVAGQADDLAAAATRIASFEEQVAGLLAEREGNLGTISKSGATSCSAVRNNCNWRWPGCATRSMPRARRRGLRQPSARRWRRSLPISRRRTRRPMRRKGR